VSEHSHDDTDSLIVAVFPDRSRYSCGPPQPGAQRDWLPEDRRGTPGCRRRRRGHHA